MNVTIRKAAQLQYLLSAISIMVTVFLWSTRSSAVSSPVIPEPATAIFLPEYFLSPVSIGVTVITASDSEPEILGSAVPRLWAKKDGHILTSGMAKLYKHHGTVGMNPLHSLAKRLDIPVVGHGQHAGAGGGIRPVCLWT